jgi:hypothetical protein
MLMNYIIIFFIFFFFAIYIEWYIPQAGSDIVDRIMTSRNQEEEWPLPSMISCRECPQE